MKVVKVERKHYKILRKWKKRNCYGKRKKGWDELGEEIKEETKGQRRNLSGSEVMKVGGEKWSDEGRDGVRNYE